MNNPYQKLHDAGWPELAELGWRKLSSSTHGDLPAWLEAIEALPGGDGHHQLDRDAPALGRPVENQALVKDLLQRLHPWRKGPLELGGIRIDTEWRSDWKWNRLAPHLDLRGQRIMDIGSGNGYFGLRMLGAGAKLVVGVDPTLVFVMQWLAMQKFAPALNNFVLPAGIEDLPMDAGGFDSVFSMGVLYHRREPLEHFEQLKRLVNPGGHLLLETLILEGEGEKLLEPKGRYARMRNVHAIPSLGTLLRWMEQAGLPGAQVLDISRTSTAEQRSTDWMTFESLRECLDEQNPHLTVEGHPAPVRAALLVKVNM